MNPPLVTLADNTPLSERTLDAMLALREELAALTDRRAQLIADLSLDESFCLPDANWGEGAHNDFRKAYLHIRHGDYDVLDRLRFWTGVFTGYNVMTLGSSAGHPSVDMVPTDYDTWLLANCAEPDFWVGLWREATSGMPPRYVYSPPRMLGEVGWDLGGIVVNQNTYAYQERINLLYVAGILDFLEKLGRPARILEIGGGYGALALALRRMVPDSVYVVCDLPESLMFSGLYLTATSDGTAPAVLSEKDCRVPSDGFAVLPNYLFSLLVDQGESFDLVINTLSMAEMSEHQIRTYASGISRMIGTTGLFFEQNQDNSSVGMLNCKPFLSPYFAGRLHIAGTGQQVAVGPVFFSITQGFVDIWANASLEVDRSASG